MTRQIPLLHAKWGTERRQLKRAPNTNGRRAKTERELCRHMQLPSSQESTQFVEGTNSSPHTRAKNKYEGIELTFAWPLCPAPRGPARKKPRTKRRKTRQRPSCCRPCGTGGPCPKIRICKYTFLDILWEIRTFALLFAMTYPRKSPTDRHDSPVRTAVTARVRGE